MNQFKEAPVDPHDDDDFRSLIRCPHCLEPDCETTEYPEGLRYDGDTAEQDCSSCGKPFKIRISVSYEYATSALPPAKIEQVHTAGSNECEALPPHNTCWEDANGMIRWRNEP